MAHVDKELGPRYRRPSQRRQTRKACGDANRKSSVGSLKLAASSASGADSALPSVKCSGESKGSMPVGPDAPVVANPKDISTVDNGGSFTRLEELMRKFAYRGAENYR
jgi:hypothetical protein